MTRLSRDDRGQITTALVMVGIVLLVALGLLVTKLGQATDQRSQVQSAADAAALAGAQQIRSQLPGLVLTAIRNQAKDPFAGSPACGMGNAEAADFALRAGASVTTYCYYPDSDTVQVSVESLSVSVSGDRARADAQARVGMTLGPCDVLPTPPSTTTSAPATTSTPTMTATPTTTSPPTNVTMACGGLSLDVVLDHAGVITQPSISDIFDMFEPALKS